MVERTSPVYCCLNLKIMKIDTFAKYLVSNRKNDGTYMSYSVHNGKRSALLSLFKAAEVAMSDEFYSDLSEFHAGLKRTISKEAQEKGTQSQTEKDHLSLDAYKN